MRASARASFVLLIPLGIVTLAASAQANFTAQQPQTHIAFDVVSVKPNHTDEAHPGSMIRGDGFDAENQGLLTVMYWAFGLGMDRDPRHFNGLPSWISSERFDIIAKVADADVSTWKKLPDSEKERMVLAVLQDRFRLSFHRETHDQPIYALVVAKDGPKMASVEVPGSDHAYGKAGYVGVGRDGAIGGHATMDTLAAYLNQQNLGRPILDRTGLTGNYDFKLQFTPFPMGATPDEAATPSGSSYPYIFAALEEQLGLKLEPTRGPVETFVIDHIERPSEN